MVQVRRDGAFARRLLFLVLAVSWPAAAAAAPYKPWSVTVYFGPSTTKFFGAVFTSGRFEATGAMLGVAGDARLTYLGAGISLAAEAQVTQYWFGHRNTSVALGLGFQANAPFGIKGTRFSVYDGPSYAFDPPHTSIGYHSVVYPAARVRFLNYIGMEYAVALSRTSSWDGVIRLYHRSGAWGVYSDHDDDGLAVGLGLKYRF
ncbi:MAG: hypothetical protein WDM91_22045 [Rhizomicrobium sp.]